MKTFDGIKLTDEQALKRQKYRKLRRLAPLRDVLPPAWRARYDEWVRETEEPEHAEYVTPPVQVRWGLESPQSTEDMRPMSVEQVVAFLSTWQPSENPLGPVPGPAGAASRHVRLHLVADGSAHGQPSAAGDGLVLQQPLLPLEPPAVAHQ